MVIFDEVPHFAGAFHDDLQPVVTLAVTGFFVSYNLFI